jgi:hypothetical protein
VIGDTPADKPPEQRRLVLLTNDAMRARRRPAAIAMAWGYELVLAALLVWPAAAYVGNAYGAHPHGDEPLFRPGGLALADFVLRARPLFAALGAHVTPLLGVGVVLGLVPLAFLLVEIAHVTPARRVPPLALAVPRAWAVFPRFLGMLLAATLLQGLVVLVGLVLAGVIAGAAARGMGEARAQQLAAVIFLSFAAVATAMGIVHDLARAAAIRFDVGAVRAVRLGWSALRRGVTATAWSWAWRGAIGVVPIAAAALLSTKLAGREGAALWAMALIHQLVALARVALRASWLAKALRVVDAAHRVVSG